MTLPSRTRRRQQTLARLARRAPGYDWALHELLPKVRRNPLLTDLAWRVFVPGTTVGEIDVPFHGGRYLQGSDVNRLPIIGVAGLGLDDAGVGALIEEVAARQRELASFRPLLILDRPAFGTAREHGYVLEVLTSQAQWDDAAPTWPSWSDYAGDRLASLIDHYRLWHLALTEDGHLRPLDVAVLEQLRRRLPAELKLR